MAPLHFQIIRDRFDWAFDIQHYSSGEKGE